MDLLLVVAVIALLASIGRGGRAGFKVPKTARGKRYLAERRKERA